MKRKEMGLYGGGGGGLCKILLSLMLWRCFLVVWLGSYRLIGLEENIL